MSVRNVAKVLILLGSTAAALNVSAEETKSLGFSLEANFGLSSHSLDADGYEDESERDTGYGVFAAYSVLPAISVGLGYIDYGKATLFDSNHPSLGKVDFNSSISSVIAFVALSTIDRNRSRDPFYGYARFGVADSDYALDAEYSSGKDSLISESAIGFWGGLGVGYRINSSLDVTGDLNWQVFEVDGAQVSNALGVSNLDVQAALYSVGVRYSF